MDVNLITKLESTLQKNITTDSEVYKVLSWQTRRMKTNNKNELKKND